MLQHKCWWLFSTTCALLIGFVLGQAEKSETRAAAQTGKASVPFPMSMRIGGNLYLQTSAEYQAACLQTYRCAIDRLKQLVADQKPDGRPPAVVMDLDETVFDNSAFQTYLYRTNQEYTDDLWGNYERNFAGDVTLIPGAKAFIDEATALGVNVVYLSNRLQENNSATIAALKRLDVAGNDVESRLFLKTEMSDKTARRRQVAERFHVLMFIGDNLRDFDEAFVAPKIGLNPTSAELSTAVAARKAEVNRTAARWGSTWFILPNPVYGEWDKLIQVDPIELMHPTSMPNDGIR